MKRVIFLIYLYFTSMTCTWAAAPHAENAYVRAMPPGQMVTGAFMVLQNPSDSQQALVRAESDVAKTVELHEHINNNGVMQMRPVKKIEIKANSSTDLKPGGYHVMLIGLKQSLKVGDIVDIKLSFDDGSTQLVHAPVKKIGESMGMMKDHKGMQHKMGGDMQKIKMMKHANPMPNLMRVIMKQGEKLSLSDDQQAALKKWRKENSAKTKAMAKKVIALEAQLKEKSLAGTDADEIKMLAEKVLAIRLNIIEGKTKCRDNMRKVLKKEQWEKLIGLYKKM